MDHADQWYILSAEHGLLRPDAIIAPYNKTLNEMPLAERRMWADKVLNTLATLLAAGDEVIILAGKRYREFVIPQIEARGVRVSVPMKGLGIGEQKHWLNSHNLHDLEHFYALLGELSCKTGGPRRLRDCHGKDQWPKRGVYFIFEPGEIRAADPMHYRVVRVGTHAITDRSNSTLWARIRTHRGFRDGRGNHRGSIFRSHVGAAMLRKEGLTEPTTWIDSNASREVRDLEADMERRVSEYLGSMSVLWLAVDDPPSTKSDRATIERNAIGMLTKRDAVFDSPSANWLGHHSLKEEIRTSGLWNVNHVGAYYESDFLKILERCIAGMVRGKLATGR
jgi:hypothetical protein